MAKSSAATKETASTALAVAATDELAEILGDVALEHDGLEELASEDIKIAVKVANFNGVDAAGDPIPKNVFYDTLDETTSKEIEASLLTYHKTAEWREFDNAASKTVVHCRSLDRVTGEMANGTRRACATCPDKEWVTGPDGKRTKRCGTTYNLIGVERLTQKPFIYRARKTAVEPLVAYLNRYFIGRRPTKAGLANYPLFAFQTRLTLKMETKGGKSYAVPVFERGGIQTRDEILACEQNAKFYREQMIPVLAAAEKHDVDASDTEGGAPDTSFDVDAMDAAPAAKGANHF